MLMHKLEIEININKILNKITNNLSSSMEINEYKNYILSFFSYKFLSGKLEKSKQNKEEFINDFGYFLEKEFLFSSIVLKIKENKFTTEDLVQALLNFNLKNNPKNGESNFIDLFDDIKLETVKWGETEEIRNERIKNIILSINEFPELENENALGDIYIYLIENFASTAGKKAGEFYTPSQVAKLISKLSTYDKEEINSAYDPTCGSGSMLLSLGKKIKKYYGQESINTVCNIAKMNMLIHGIKIENFSIQNGDVLKYPKHLDKKFDLIVANPPYGVEWSSEKEELKDPRFSSVNQLAPKNTADFAFVQHIIYQLKENGTASVLLPVGALFRERSEGLIRKFLIDSNFLDSVINLPENIFTHTKIQTTILIFKKDRKRENIFFIDASNEFERKGKLNFLSDENIEKIFNTYFTRTSINRFSYLATNEEVKKNDYNLNITRYVRLEEDEEEINFIEMQEMENKLNEEIEEIDEKLNKYFDDLIEN